MNIHKYDFSETDSVIESLEACNAFYEQYLQIIERLLDPQLCKQIKLCVAYRTTYQESYDRDSVLAVSGLSSNSLTRFTNETIDSGSNDPLNQILKNWL